MGTQSHEDSHAREPEFCSEGMAQKRKTRVGRQMCPAWLCGGNASDTVDAAPHDVPRVKTDEFVQGAEASNLITRFCENHPMTRVDPTERELVALWNSCRLLDQSAVAAAIYNQLAGAIESHVWQPRARALAVIEHLYQAEDSRLIAHKVAVRSEELLRFLSTEVPECHDAACQVLLLRQLAEVLPSGQEVRMANEGGLLYFLAESTKTQDEAFKIGDQVVAHSLRTAALNGMYGTVVGFHDGRTKVLFADMGEKALKPLNLKLLDSKAKPWQSSTSFSRKQRQDNLLTLPAPPDIDLLDISDGSTHLTAPTDDRFTEATDLLSLLPDTLMEGQKSCPMLPADLDFLQPAPVYAPVQAPRTPEVFNIAGGDSAYETISNPELSRMFSFAPRQVPSIPFLGTSKDCGIKTVTRSGHDPFASVVADAYVKCLKV